MNFDIKLLLAIRNIFEGWDELGIQDPGLPNPDVPHWSEEDEGELRKFYGELRGQFVRELEERLSWLQEYLRDPAGYISSHHMGKEGEAPTASLRDNWPPNWSGLSEEEILGLKEVPGPVYHWESDDPGTYMSPGKWILFPEFEQWVAEWRESHKVPSWSGKSAKSLWAITFPTGVSRYSTCYVALFGRKPTNRDRDAVISYLIKANFPTEEGEEWKGEGSGVASLAPGRLTEPHVEEGSHEYYQDLFQKLKDPTFKKGPDWMMKTLGGREGEALADSTRLALLQRAKFCKAWALSDVIEDMWEDSGSIYLGTMEQFEEVMNSINRTSRLLSSTDDPVLVNVATGNMWYEGVDGAKVIDWIHN